MWNESVIGFCVFVCVCGQVTYSLRNGDNSTS